MLKVKTQCTYGRGGEEINDTTRHDYVSLELNTLRVGKKMEIRVVYKHTPFPPPSSLTPFGHPLLSLSLSLLLLLLLHLPFFPFSLSLLSSCIFFPLSPLLPFIVQEWVNRGEAEEKWEGEWCRLEMLIIISARAPFYNAVISSHLYPKYGIWGGGQLTL